jgi:hypothetical protein
VGKATRKAQRRPAAGSVTTSVTRRPEGGVGPGRSEFNPDYTHVVKDLRRIGLLAGSLILGLIVLAFFLK